MFNGHDPFPGYARVQMFRLIQKVRNYFKADLSKLLTWEAGGKVWVLLQPLIMFALLIEDSPSLTRAIIFGHWSTVALTWLLGFLTFAMHWFWVARYLFGLTKTGHIGASFSLRALASCVGIIAAVSATAPTTSYVLIGGYTLSSLYLLWATAILDRELHGAAPRRSAEAQSER